MDSLLQNYNSDDELDDQQNFPQKLKRSRYSSSSSSDSSDSSSSSGSSSSSSSSSSDSDTSSDDSDRGRKSRKTPKKSSINSKPEASSSNVAKHDVEKSSKMAPLTPEIRHVVIEKNPVKSSHCGVEKKRSPVERDRHRNRSSSRDRYESKRNDRDKDRRDRDRLPRHHRDYDDKDKDRRDRYSSRGSASGYKNDRRDRRDKYDRHDRKDRDRSRDRKDKRNYDRDRNYRRSSSRDRKRKSSDDKSRRSRSRSKSAPKIPVSPISTAPPPLITNTLPTGFSPNVRPPPINPALIPPLMAINVGPIELPSRPTTSSELSSEQQNDLSRISLIRSKAAQLEKMGIDVLQQSKKAADSVPLPSYYNPGIVNPVRYADQVQKRKLLWGNKTAESKDVSSNISKWEQAKFSQDKDGKMASKFLRLMGVKDPHKTATADDVKPGTSTSGDSINKQEELFSTMEQQYEVARQVTHTMRGVGLGFGSQPRTF
ncbi:arginine/serine-rich coiled-coil protein 2 isoform X2 [Armigeres subalbatus]|uniref:arginine/serine-rich coiled-coil protein 2 isoform X2 n=1 Tax=Armigeres subalbatus TaxID=124917 RepID=UPI002ED15A9C